MPSQQQSNLTALSNLQMQSQQLVDSEARDRDRLQNIEAQIADLTSPEALQEDAVVDAAGGTVKGGTTAQQLAAARSALAQMELRLKPEHPDIARMKRIIRDLEKRADAEAADAPVSPEASKPRTPAEVGASARGSSSSRKKRRPSASRSTRRTKSRSVSTPRPGSISSARTPRRRARPSSSS